MKQPTYLHYIKVQTISNAECSEEHKLQTNFKVDDNKICTSTIAGYGVCHADSGGPLVLYGQLIGLLSWGVPCSRGKPDVFERVSEYVDWIEQMTGVVAYGD